MFKRLFSIFRKPELEEVKEEEVPEVFRISFVYNTDDKVLVKLRSELDFDPEILATVSAYASSIPGQLDLLQVIEKGLVENDDTESYDIFLRHFLTIKAKEVVSSSSEEIENEPCVKPLEML